MLGGFLSGLLVGWILSLFNVDKMMIEVLQPFIPVCLTTSHYYMTLGMIGLIGGAFGR